MRFSILHLSDLHRDTADEIDTVALLASLERDLERAADESPSVPRPSLCIVTGDMIFGASPGTPAPDDELRRQYAQALEFLNGLSNRFFNGNRDHVVILPGNHDVSLPAFMRSVECVPIPEASGARARLAEEIHAPRSRLRWSWRELCAYRIVDADEYRARLAPFAKLYEAFYGGRRGYSLEPHEQHDVFDFPDLGFCVFALSSCYDNDPLRRAGAFHPAAVSQVCTAARAPARTGRLLAAAWHHNLFGGPSQDDYLESGVLQLFIDAGISVAFHGHQHLTDCVDERYRVGPDIRKVTVVSAGTLCAAPRHLTPGEPRSYNIIEVDTDHWTGRVHQRRMVNHVYSLPIWGPGHFASTNASVLDFDLSPPLEARPPDLDLRLVLEEADRLLGGRRWSDAVVLLRDHRAVPLARPLLAQALVELGDPRQLLEILSPPVTSTEAVVVGGAILDSGGRLEAEAFLALPLVMSTQDASVREIARRVRERKAP
jgi:hypothetical protein